MGLVITGTERKGGSHSCTYSATRRDDRNESPTSSHFHRVPNSYSYLVILFPVSLCGANSNRNLLKLESIRAGCTQTRMSNESFGCYCHRVKCIMPTSVCGPFSLSPSLLKHLCNGLESDNRHLYRNVRKMNRVPVRLYPRVQPHRYFAILNSGKIN